MNVSANIHSEPVEEEEKRREKVGNEMKNTIQSGVCWLFIHLAFSAVEIYNAC